MAAKIEVAGENRHVKKTVALTLVRKAIAEWEVYMVRIRMRRAYTYRPESKGLTIVSFVFDYDYPEQLFDPELAKMPAMRYPQQLAPKDQRTCVGKRDHRTVTFLP